MPDLKKISGILAVIIVISSIICASSKTKNDNLSTLALLSIEALAQGETSSETGAGSTVYCADHMTYHTKCANKNQYKCVSTTHN